MGSIVSFQTYVDSCKKTDDLIRLRSLIEEEVSVSEKILSEGIGDYFNKLKDKAKNFAKNTVLTNIVKYIFSKVDPMLKESADPFDTINSILSVRSQGSIQLERSDLIKLVSEKSGEVDQTKVNNLINKILKEASYFMANFMYMKDAYDSLHGKETPYSELKYSMVNYFIDRVRFESIRISDRVEPKKVYTYTGETSPINKSDKKTIFDWVPKGLDKVTMGKKKVKRKLGNSHYTDVIEDVDLKDEFYEHANKFSATLDEIEVIKGLSDSLENSDLKTNQGSYRISKYVKGKTSVVQFEDKTVNVLKFNGKSVGNIKLGDHKISELGELGDITVADMGLSSVGLTHLKSGSMTVYELLKHIFDGFSRQLSGDLFRRNKKLQDDLSLMERNLRDYAEWIALELGKKTKEQRSIVLDKMKSNVKFFLSKIQEDGEKNSYHQSLLETDQINLDDIVDMFQNVSMENIMSKLRKWFSVKRKIGLYTALSLIAIVSVASGYEKEMLETIKGLWVSRGIGIAAGKIAERYTAEEISEMFLKIYNKIKDAYGKYDLSITSALKTLVD